jgi:hypothetical protein
VNNGGFEIIAVVYQLDTDCLVMLYQGRDPT